METLDTIENIHGVVNNVRTKQQNIEEAWFRIEKNLVNTKDLTELEVGVVKVVNWILGPAENLLNSRQKVGYDVSSAEELRRDHETLELQCWNTYGTYAELLHKINRLTIKNEGLFEQKKDLMSQKDFMDFVCRSFALRLERRRNILITSLRFFRLVSEYFDRTGEVFDSLVMGNKANDFKTAAHKLKDLQENQTNLGKIIVIIVVGAFYFLIINYGTYKCVDFRCCGTRTSQGRGKTFGYVINAGERRHGKGTESGLQ